VVRHEHARVLLLFPQKQLAWKTKVDPSLIGHCETLSLQISVR